MVADELDYKLLDSGAMYRAVTLLLLQQKKDPFDRAASAAAARAADIRFDFSGRKRVFLNNRDVTDKIRTPEVTRNIAPVAANPEVRAVLVEKQRSLGKDGGIVAEGRDIGTVVFPDAELKIFMVASIEERARRRQKELLEKGVQVDLEQLMREIRRRDESDIHRQYGALARASDAIILDTSTMTLEEQVAFIVDKARKRGA